MNLNRPKVGIGVLITNPEGKLLLGQRINSTGENTWAPPGGHLEYGEDFTTCARRELFEETGIEVDSLDILGFTNDIFQKERRHYVTIFLHTQLLEMKTAIVKEPDKCKEWGWFSYTEFPENLFLTVKNLIKNQNYQFMRIFKPFMIHENKNHNETYL